MVFLGFLLMHLENLLGKLMTLENSSGVYSHNIPHKHIDKPHLPESAFSQKFHSKISNNVFLFSTLSHFNGERSFNLVKIFFWSITAWWDEISIKCDTETKKKLVHELFEDFSVSSSICLSCWWFYSVHSSKCATRKNNKRSGKDDNFILNFWWRNKKCMSKLILRRSQIKKEL